MQNGGDIQLVASPHLSAEDISAIKKGYELRDVNPPLFEMVSQTILTDTIHEILAALPEREREVIRLRFGFEDGREYTLEEVGTRFNVTRERIRQIEAKAIRRLRHPSRSGKILEL